MKCANVVLLAVLCPTLPAAAWQKVAEGSFLKGPAPVVKTSCGEDYTFSAWVKIDRWTDPENIKAGRMFGVFARGWKARMTFGHAEKYVTVQTNRTDPKTRKDVVSHCGASVERDIRVGEWNHLAFVYSPAASEIALYVNGALKAGGKGRPVPEIGLDSAVPFTVGSLPGCFPLEGQIARYRIYDGALSAEEIAREEADFVKKLLDEEGVPSKGVGLAEFQSVRHEAQLMAADRKLAKGKSFYWATVDPMGPETYVPDSDLDPALVGQPVDVACAKGEYEAASVVVRSLEDLKGLVPVVSELTCGKARLPGSIVDTRIVKVMAQALDWNTCRSRHMRALRGTVLLHDDALVRVDYEKLQNYLRLDRPNGKPEYRCVSEFKDERKFEHFIDAADWNVRDAKEIRPLDLRKRFSLQYWFTVLVPEDAKPGLYRGTIAFRAQGGKTVASIPLRLRVLPFALPEPRTRYDLSKKMYTGVSYRHNWHKYGKPDYAGSITSNGRNEQQFRAELRSLKAHGEFYVTELMQFGFPYWSWNAWRNPTEGREVTAAETKFAPYFKRTLEIMKEEGMPLDTLLLWCAGNFGFRESYGLHERFPGEHRDVLKRCVEAVSSVARSVAGNDTRLYFYGIDEAHGKELEAELPCWQEIRRLGADVVASGQRRNTALVAPHLRFAIMSGVPDRQFSREMHKYGGVILNYANPQAGTKHRASVYRNNYGFGIYCNDYDGYMTYAWNVSANNPWNDFDNRDEGDLALVIGTADGVVDTPSHEGYREAYDDLRYLTLLRQLCERHPGKLADEAKAWVDTREPFRPGFNATNGRLIVIDYILKHMEK